MDINGKKIVFYAPVGKGIPVHKLGGGEKGCQRTRAILTESGFDVITIDKPVTSKGKVHYVLQLIWDIVRISWLMLFFPDALLYIVGFYEKNISIEKFFLSVGKIFNHKVIYEARNGRLIKAYNEYDYRYKKKMDYVLEKADLIFAQGKDYVTFIEDKYNKKAIYTPNYVLKSFIKPYNRNRKSDCWRLIYFGRVSESKNVDIVIKVVAELIKRKVNVKLSIIGGYTDQYYKKLIELIKTENINAECITFFGAKDFDFIVQELQSTHFFVFPSEEKMEGHSNSLTEAMTFGVVPIASTAGFNQSIIGKDELISNDINPVKYADMIESIIRNDKWSFYSEFVYDRINQYFTEDIVKRAIIDSITELLS